MQLPVWCECGRIVTYGGEDRCEDCWADDQKRLGIRRNGTSKYIDNICIARLPDLRCNMLPFLSKCGQPPAPPTLKALSQVRPEPDRQPE